MSRVIFLIGGGLIFCSVLLDFTGVVMRIVGAPAWDVSSSLAVWLVAWAVFLAAGPLVAERGGHVAIMAIPAPLGRGGRLFLERVALVATVIASAILAYGGTLMVLSLYNRGMVSSLSVKFPHFLVKGCVAVGMTIAVAYGVVAIFRGMRSASGDQGPQAGPGD